MGTGCISWLDLDICLSAGGDYDGLSTYSPSHGIIPKLRIFDWLGLQQ